MRYVDLLWFILKDVEETLILDYVWNSDQNHWKWLNVIIDIGNGLTRKVAKYESDHYLTVAWRNWLTLIDEHILSFMEMGLTPL